MLGKSGLISISLLYILDHFHLMILFLFFCSVFCFDVTWWRVLIIIISWRLLINDGAFHVQGYGWCIAIWIVILAGAWIPHLLWGMVQPHKLVCNLHLQTCLLADCQSVFLTVVISYFYLRSRSNKYIYGLVQFPRKWFVDKHNCSQKRSL